MFSSLFNLSVDSTYDHPCIKPFPTNLLYSLKEKSNGIGITGEYLSVAPDFRKEKMGQSLAEVLAGLQMKIFTEMNLDISFAATVRAAKVDSIIKHFGFKEVGSYSKIGVDCIQLINTPETYHDHPNSDVREIINRFWNNRTDLTGLTLPTHNSNQKAA
jgi:hypothetical protein